MPMYLLHHHCSNVIHTLTHGEMRREVVLVMALIKSSIYDFLLKVFICTA